MIVVQLTPKPVGRTHLAKRRWRMAIRNRYREEDRERRAAAVRDATSTRKYDAIADQVPFVMDWCKFKGEKYVAAIDFDASIPAGRPIMALSYCMTKAMNHTVVFHAPWNPDHFKPHPRLSTWGKQES